MKMHKIQELQQSQSKDASNSVVRCVQQYMHVRADATTFKSILSFSK
jgi:hypothetical protein